MNFQDVIREMERMLELQDVLYNNYQIAISKKEFTKASELLWGAISNIAVGIAIMYEKKLSDHKATVHFIDEIISGEYPQYAQITNSIEKLHSNFYHAWMSNDDFKIHSGNAELIRAALLQLWQQRREKLPY